LGQGAADQGGSVLLAEHDPAVAGMLVRYLARDGLQVRLAATPELALAGLTPGGAPDLAVLDLTMPGLDPRRVRRALRIPVVFLVSPGPRPRGLNGGGARRWLTRPFGPRLLVATVLELLRDASQDQSREPHSVAIAGLRLDRGRRVAEVGNREVPLTGTEFAILADLLASGGRPRSRRQLLTAVGRKPADRKPADRAADVYIAQIRAKIGVPGLIRTVRGAGYALDAAAVPRLPELGGRS
jgi:DNA-binding response OmpR family regulator